MAQAQSLHPASFPYRAWAICAQTRRRELFERHLDRAIAEAPAHHINRLELHDYYIPWVNYGITYGWLGRLTALRPLYQGRSHAADLTFDSAKAYMKDVFARVKQAGLKLNLWYHVGRDVPPELAQTYGEYTDVDSGFAFEFERNSLGEFFERYPEVDAITLTSLHETDSVLSRPGKMPRIERLRRLYGAVQDACRQAGREFVLRDFIVKREDFDDFIRVLDDLDDDVIVMTKNVLADWSYIHQEVNPFIARYAGRRLVLEFDLYGEFHGRGDLPYVDPDYFYKRIRQLLPFGAEGAVGRIVHDTDRPHRWGTIFDSLEEVNVAAFSRTLHDPGPTIETLGEWAPAMLTNLGLSLWVPWARERFGQTLAPRVIPLLRECPHLVASAQMVCGYKLHGRGLTPPSNFAPDGPYRRRYERIDPGNSLEDWVRREEDSIALVRAEKDQAVSKAVAVLARARGLYDEAPSASLAELVTAFENLHLVARATRAAALLFALGLRDPAGSDLDVVIDDTRQLIDDVDAARPPSGLHGLAATLAEWIAWAEERRRNA